MKDGQPLIRELGTCGALQKCSHYYLRRLDNSGWPESVIIRKGGEVPREDVPEDCPYPVSCIPYPGGNGRRVTRPGQASHREARNYSRRCRAARASGPRQRGSRRPKRKGRLRKDITKVNAGPRAPPLPPNTLRRPVQQRHRGPSPARTGPPRFSPKVFQAETEAARSSPSANPRDRGPRSHRPIRPDSRLMFSALNFHRRCPRRRAVPGVRDSGLSSHDLVFSYVCVSARETRSRSPCCRGGGKKTY
jgi:hypothetical protein